MRFRGYFIRGYHIRVPTDMILSATQHGKMSHVLLWPRNAKILTESGLLLCVGEDIFCAKCQRFKGATRIHKMHLDDTLTSTASK